jgi:hypothetical protein
MTTERKQPTPVPVVKQEVVYADGRTKNQLKAVARSLNHRGNLSRYNQAQLRELISKLTENITNVGSRLLTPPEKINTSSKKPLLTTNKKRLSKKDKKRLRAQLKRAANKTAKESLVRPVIVSPAVSAGPEITLTSEAFVNNLLNNMHTSSSVINKKYGVAETNYTLKLDDRKLVLTNETPINVIEHLFKRMLLLTIQSNNLINNDKLKFFIDSDSLRGKIETAFMDAKDMTAKLITDKVLRMLQSSESIDIENLKMGFIFIRIPSRGAGGPSIAVKLDDYYIKKGYKQQAHMLTRCPHARTPPHALPRLQKRGLVVSSLCRGLGAA